MATNDPILSFADEIWQPLRFEQLPADANRLEISTYGRVRSYSQISKGTGMPAGI